MKLWSITIALAMIATVLVAEQAKPQMYQWQCPGPNGGWGWQVLEDRDGDGRYDWETRHECDGSICEGPLGVSNKRQIGYLSGWVSLSFTQLVCDESVPNGWSLRLFDANGLLMGTVEHSCSDTTAKLILPEVVQESLKGADFRKRQALGRYAFVFENLSATWNAASSTLDLTCRVKIPLPLTVRILERNRGQEDQVIATVVTPQPVVGERVIHVPVPPLHSGMYYWQVMAPNGSAVTSVFTIESLR